MTNLDTPVEIWQDVTDHFMFIEDLLVYVDGPFEGFLRHLQTGDLFAFRCAHFIPDLGVHWVIVPAVSTQLSVEEVFASARTNPSQQWLSVIEDRRGKVPRLFPAWMTTPLPPSV